MVRAGGRPFCWRYTWPWEPGFADTDETSRRILTAWKSDPQGSFDFCTFKLPRE